MAKCSHKLHQSQGHAPVDQPADHLPVLNLFIGVIVAAMEAEHDAEESAGRQELQDDQAAILAEIRALREEVRELKSGIRLV